MHRYIRTYIHAYIHTYIHTCIHTYVHTHIYIYIYTGKLIPLLVLLTIHPPNNNLSSHLYFYCPYVNTHSECLERLADKVYHTCVVLPIFCSPITLSCGKRKNRGYELQTRNAYFYIRV
jgi:hypothetical protein